MTALLLNNKSRFSISRFKNFLLNPTGDSTITTVSQPKQQTRTISNPLKDLIERTQVGILEDQQKQVNSYSINTEKIDYYSILKPVYAVSDALQQQQQQTYESSRQKIPLILSSSESEIISYALYHNTMLRNALVKFISEFVLQKRTKFDIGLDENILTLMSKNPKINDIVNSELMSQEIKPEKILEWNTKINTINQDIELHENLTTLGIQAFCFGSGYLHQIRDFQDKDFTQYGRPISLYPINRGQLVEIISHRLTKKFEGIKYRVDDDEKQQWIAHLKDRTEKQKEKKDKIGEIVSTITTQMLQEGSNELTISRTSLIPLIIDNFNPLKYGENQGMSRVLPLLPVIATIKQLDEEFIPSSAKKVGRGYNFINTGSPANASVDIVGKQVVEGDVIVHNFEKLKAETLTMQTDLMSLINARKESMYYVLLQVGLPPFLFLEESQSYAKAKEETTVFFNTTVPRLRTLFRNAIEYYYYDPLFADLNNTTVEKIRERKLKLKMVFDESFDIEKKIELATKLQSLGILRNDLEVLEFIGEDKILQLRKDLDRKIETIETETIKKNRNETENQSG